jgi:hypothetical protein
VQLGDDFREIDPALPMARSIQWSI